VNYGAALASWNLVAEGSPTPSPRVTKLQTADGCCYLKSGESTESVERDLDLLEHLAAAGLPVPRYIPTAAGQRYIFDAGKPFWLSRQLPGHHFEQFRGSTGVEQVERLATPLGELHRVFVSAPNPQRFPVFRDSGEELIGQLLARATPFDIDRLQRLRGAIISVALLPKQLIHRDYHRGNVLFTDEALAGFLDFDLVLQGPRLFDVCYCASGVLSESFREPGYVEYWLTILEAIFRAYGRNASLSRQERSLAWSMLMTIELIVMRSCVEAQALEGALMNQGMLFWFEEHRSEIEAAVAGRIR
jgi:Ser/Thr protein kinase RdoA (MazF antagonist)